MLAFQLAVEAGADMIELDVRMTRDGVAVVMHDETIDRATNGTGKVCALTWSQLQQVTLKPREPGQNTVTTLSIPTLEQVFEFAKDHIGLNIEIKDPSPALASRIVNLIDSTRFSLSNLIISSFHFDLLRWISERRPDIQLAPLFSELPAELVDLPGTWVHPRHTCVDANSMALFRQMGRKVNVWTVNDPTKQKELIDLDVDGIITDDPRGLVGHLRGSPQ